MKIALTFAIIAAFCGSSVVIFAKLALEVFQPFTLVFIRFLIASITLLPFVKKELNIATFKSLFVAALFGSLNPILLFIALQFTQASVAPLIYASVPAMTAMYLGFIKKQKISSEQIIGIALGLIGVSLIIIFPLFSKGNLSVFEIIKGNLLILGAAVGFLIYGLISKQKQKNTKASPIALTFYFSVVTLILSIPFAWHEISVKPIVVSNINSVHILSAISIGIIGTSLFYFSYQYALKLGSELSAALFTYLQPVITAVFAILLLGETITTSMIIGGILAVIGAQIAAGQLHFMKKFYGR